MFRTSVKDHENPPSLALSLVERERAGQPMSQGHGLISAVLEVVSDAKSIYLSFLILICFIVDFLVFVGEISLLMFF